MTTKLYKSGGCKICGKELNINNYVYIPAPNSDVFIPVCPHHAGVSREMRSTVIENEVENEG